jgi:hypothetical protein
MRIIAFAVLLFAAGFGIVAIGQQAFAYFGHGRIEAGPNGSVITGEARQTETLDDYVVRANQAFAAMDRSCSAAERGGRQGHADG